MKNLNQEQIEQRISSVDARRAEEKFFTETEPWSKVELANRRFGAAALSKRLGQLLCEQIKADVPALG